MSVSLTDEFIERVSASTDIVSVISGYVPLKRKGNRYWGCCPFHQEKTASFSVQSSEGFFYCFGCHVGGNVFKFLSMMENVNYYEAVRMQAERLNIPLPVAEQSPQEIARENHLKDLRRLHDMAKTFFHNCLTKTKYGADGLIYLHKRGITDDIIQEFKLGFAPDAWDKLKVAFMKRDIPVEILLESGLVKQQADGKKFAYDRFRNRVMIPIADDRGQVVAFGGRIIGDGEPKYLNSPETAIFNKRKLLFGFDKAKQEIQRAGFALMVEGYMDVISVYAAGVRNVVASLGTAFSQEHCRKIMRLGAELYFCYDSDTAGQAATVRGLSIAKSTGAVVKVVSIPDGKDPDEFIRKHGVEAFRQVISKAMPMMDFYIKYVSDRVDLDSPEGSRKAKDELAPLLLNITNPTEKTHYVKLLARLLSISEQEIRESQENKSLIQDNKGQIIPQQQYDVRPDVPQRQKVYIQDDAVRRGSRVLVRAAWKNPALIDQILAKMSLDYLPEWVGEVFNAIDDIGESGELPTAERVTTSISEAAAQELSLALVEELGEPLEVMYSQCMHSMRYDYLKQTRNYMRRNVLQMKNKAEQFNSLRDIRKIEKEMDEFELKNSINRKN